MNPPVLGTFRAKKCCPKIFLPIYMCLFYMFYILYMCLFYILDKQVKNFSESQQKVLYHNIISWLILKILVYLIWTRTGEFPRLWKYCLGLFQYLWINFRCGDSGRFIRLCCTQFTIWICSTWDKRLSYRKIKITRMNKDEDNFVQPVCYSFGDHKL